ncbi:diguanylate cyclase [Dactylosporangium cerinum]|uniref:Diguanylate cyclase n=1 Tax=Dactylosporangium cerinum TaxID=1434730 RepID=A0ABV9VNW0_9ACTN
MSGTAVISADRVAAVVLGMEVDRRTADRAQAEAAERAAVELGRADLAARARLVVADALARGGELAASAPLLHEVHRWAVLENDQYVLARTHFLLSILHTCLGDNAQARRHALMSVDHLPDHVPPLIRGAHLVILALSVDVVSRADAAPYYAEALDIAAAAGDHELSRSVLNNMAYAAYQDGDAAAAGEFVERMRRLAARTGVELRPPDLDTIARVQLLQGRFDEAERTLLPLVEPGVSRRDVEGNMLPEVLLTLAEAQRLGGALDRAEATVARCRAISEQRGMVDVGARARRELARLHAARSRFREAYEEQCRYDEESQALRSAEREEQARLAQLVFESREGQRETVRFREMALRDALTGLYNRRFVDAQLPALPRGCIEVDGRAAADSTPRPGWPGALRRTGPAQALDPRRSHLDTTPVSRRARRGPTTRPGWPGALRRTGPAQALSLASLRPPPRYSPCRAEQRGEAVSAALVDIDFFKRINDTLSHEVGDLVLQRVATVMAGAVDEPATVARLGGEEFVVVLPGAGAQEAVARCERIRAAIQAHPWSELTGDLPVTVSIGVSSAADGRITSAALLSQADRNLYAAKRSGRNRVLADPS